MTRTAVDGESPTERADTVGEATLHEMTALRVTEKGPGYELLYGLGLLGVRSGSFTLVGHDGFWGSFMYTAPDHPITVTGTVNQADANELDLIIELLGALTAG